MSRIGLGLFALLLIAPPVGAQQTESALPPEGIVYPFNVTDPPKRPRLFVPMYMGLVALEASDGYLTWSAVHQGAVEQNPVVAPFTRNAFALTGFKMAATAVTIVAMERLRRQHPRAATVAVIALNGAMGWVVYHNARVVQQIR
jgi:uncharacterized protein DUF5658